MHCVECGQHVGRELHVDRADIDGELVEARRTDDRRRHVGPRQDEGDRHLRGIEPGFARDAHVFAGRRLGMSYKRAWTLVETLNGYFAEPLVIKAPGGKTGGGALLTPLGQDVLKRYRRMVAACDKAIAADVAALRKRSAS